MSSQIPGLTSISKKDARGLKPAITKKDEYTVQTVQSMVSLPLCLQSSLNQTGIFFCVAEKQKYLILLKLVLQC